MTSTPSPARRGFTLIELLVTMGIIMILISILIPAVSRMRRAAQAATTQQLIASLDAAIGIYQSDTQGWPGPFKPTADNRKNDSDGPWTTINVNGGSKRLTDSRTNANLFPTRSEELMLCLSGGLNVVWSPAPPFQPQTFQYNPENVGRGHFNIGAKNRTRLKEYMATRSNRSDIASTVPQFQTATTSDTAVPEFVDAWERPIIYVRDDDNSGSFYKAYADEEASRYYPAMVFPTTYFQSESLAGEFRQKGRYVLISAGIDGKFGTADDLTNFGPPKMQ